MLGILCGFEAEAAIARSIHGAVVTQAAARPQQARWRARELITAGATRLLSFGLAGGLAPDLPPGTIIIGTSVAAGDLAADCDAAWTAELMRALPAAHCGPVWGSEKIIVRAVDKRALYERRRCLITDMESHCVAQAAREHGVPFAVLRVVADGAARDVPPAALAPLREDGRIDLARVMLNVLRHPGQIPALIALARDTDRAMKELRAAAPALTPANTPARLAS